MRAITKLAILGGALALLGAACGGGGAVTPDADGVVTIELNEFEFSPSTIQVTPGQTVTFRLVNVGEKDHEFMIGREVDTEAGFPNGFTHDFFEGVEIAVSPMDAAMNMDDMAMDDDMEMSEDEDMEMSEDDMGDMEMGDDEHEGHTGFMVVRGPSEEATITITIPEDASGEWLIGCFEEEGAHWDDGMQGTLKIEA